MNDSSQKINSDNNPPPVMKTWKRLYSFVFINLVLLVLIFYLFTKAFE